MPNLINKKSQNLNEILKSLIELNNRDFSSFDECLMAYIQFGLDTTGFETGMVSKVEGEKYTILQTITLRKDMQNGMVMNLCDTLCSKVLDTKKTFFSNRLKDTELYNLPGQSFLNVEAFLCTPLFVENEVYGTLNFCSTKEIENSENWVFLTNIIELLGQSLSKIIKNELLQDKLEKEIQLLEMGSNLIKMGAYYRNIYTNEVTCTDSIYKIFDIDPLSDTPIVEDIKIRVAELDKAKLDRAYDKSKTEDVPPIEYRIVKKDGSFKWLRHELRCDQKKGYVLGIVQDITQLSKNRSALESKNKELEEFAYATAHDLQEPLRTISGFTKLLGSEYEENLDELGQEYLSYLRNASNRMKRQIDGLLIHFRIGKVNEFLEVDLNKVLEEILEEYDEFIQERKASVNFKKFPIVKGYYSDLKLLFKNLICNALKFCEEDTNTKISLDYTEGNDFWYFSIEDNGIGIEESHLTKVFNLFTRLNPREKYEGIGVGLTHCKKVVELHGGTIQVHSKINSGTKFEFTLKK